MIGTNYGVGNANTTFNLPDLRGRFALGKDDMGGVSADSVTAAEASVLGSRSGAEKHTLTVNEMPAHTHTLTLRHESSQSNQSVASKEDDHSSPYTATTNATGGDQAHNNMPPFQTVNYIIKT